MHASVLAPPGGGGGRPCTPAPDSLRVADEVLPDDDDGHTGGAHVLLGTRVDDAVLAHVHLRVGRVRAKRMDCRGTWEDESGTGITAAEMTLFSVKRRSVICVAWSVWCFTAHGGYST